MCNFETLLFKRIRGITKLKKKISKHLNIARSLLFILPSVAETESFYAHKDCSHTFDMHWKEALPYFLHLIDEKE